MKKTFAIFVLTLLMSMLGAKGFAYDAKIDGIYYNFSGTNATVTCRYNNAYDNRNAYSGNVVIPESVTYNGATYTVTSISSYAFNGCSGLTSVTISNSVTSIGEYAFYGCSGLTSITIPYSVTSIGEYAFFGCSSLTSVNVSVTDKSAFCNNSVVGLIASYINKPVHLIDENGKEITEYVIPDDVTSIGNGAFYRCSSLTSITIPNSVTSIGYDAFSDCSDLNFVTIPNSVTSIGSNAFYGTSLKTFIIGSGVLSIGSNAFSTRPVKTIWLTNTPPQNYKSAEGTVNYVANNLYSGLSNLKEYKFLSSMFDVDGVKYVPVSPSDRTCDAIDCAYDESTKEVNINASVSYKGIAMNVLNVMPYSFCGNNYLQKVSLDVAGNIGKYNFYGNPNLQTAILGKKITGIDEYAFSGCTKLEGIVVPDSVMAISQYAFSGCSSMKSVSIGNSTESIKNNAFQNCYALPRITIPGTVGYIGDYSFSGCSSLKEVIMANRKNGLKTISFDDWNVNTYASMVIDFAVGDTLSFNYQVSNGRLGIYTSYENDSYYGNGTFKKDFSYSGEVVLIFEPNYSSSASCSITDVKLTKGDILTLGSNGKKPLFEDCPLDSVYIGRNILYNKISNYGYSPFYRNTSLRSVVITDKEEEISDNEFYGCTNLQNVKIGDGVTAIGNWAFSGCSGLQNFAFGAQVKTIGQEAFSDCTNVMAIISKAQTPPICDSQALDDINKWSCMLNVPTGCKESYAAADQWKDFFFVEEGEGGGDTPFNPDDKKCAKPTISYNEGELSFASETEGVEFVSTISDSDVSSYHTNSILLGVTYHITVYATKPSYENSETATATLCWIDVDPRTEGIENGIASIPAHAVLIQSNGNILDIQGLEEGTPISIFNTAGQLVGLAKASAGITSISTTLSKGEVGIVKICEKAVKVIIK